MKRLTLTLSLYGVALAALVTPAFAQGNAPRVDAARFAVEANREYRGDREFQYDREFSRQNARTAATIDQLNRDVRRLRVQLREARAGRRLWARFNTLSRGADRVTVAYKYRHVQHWEARRRANELLDEVIRIRTIIRTRGLEWR